MEDRNQKQKQGSGERLKIRVIWFAAWMTKLAAAYRQEVTTPTQGIYFDGLLDLPQDRLEIAFQRAVRECKFFPSIAEIRAFEDQVEVPRERIEAARLRLRENIDRGLIENPPKLLPSVLDDKTPAKIRDVRQLSESERDERLSLLRAQLDKLTVTE